MHVIEVIPLKRGVPVESLSYYSSVPYEPGSIISIPIRNQEVPGVVTGKSEVSATKAMLRSATFSLRKLPAQEDVQSLSSVFVETARTLAEYYTASTGAVMHALLPAEILKGDIPLPHTHHVAHPETHVPEILQGTTDERFLAYRSLVRETFAHSGSLLFVVPTAAEAEEAYGHLSKGIEERIVMLTSTMTKRQLKAAYASLEDFSRSKLIIAAPAHALLERHDITTVILEHARSQHYRDRTRPYLDHRVVHETHARLAGRRLIFGDLLVRSEEEYERREERFQTLGETPKRIALPGKLRLIQMKDTPSARTPFQLFSPKVIRAITETVAEKGRVFMFAARRGLAPVVACLDCGHIFRSPESGTPYSLVRIKKDLPAPQSEASRPAGETEERWFVCSVSGRRERAPDTCTECGSWRLRERGIGIQHVYDELSKELDGMPITLFDHETAKTYKKAKFLKERFYSTKGAIMLGTQMALPYLTDTVNTSVVVSHDALIATPTWRQQEETLATLLRLRERTVGSVYVQTRTGTDDIIEHAKKGSVERFYSEELELRKTFNYPPLTVFIHLTWQGSLETVEKLEEEVRTVLKDSNISTYGAPPSPRGAHIRYGLIRLAAKEWPDPTIVEKLRTLSPAIRVMINPDRIV